MSFARNSVRTFIIRFSLLLLGITVGIINARWLGPSGVGIVALISLLQVMTYSFGNFGFPSGFSFFIARGNASSREALGITFFVCTVISVLSWAVLFLIWKHQLSPWHDISPSVFYLGLASIPPFFVFRFLEGILWGQLNILAVNISDVVRTIGYIVFLSVFVVILNLGVFGAVLSLLLSQVAAVFFLLSQILKSFKTVANHQKKGSVRQLSADIWRYARWNYMTTLINFSLDQFPVFFVKYFFSNDIVGFFYRGKSLMTRIWILPESFSTNLFPFTAASKEEAAVRRTNMLCRSFLVISACTAVAAIFVAKPIILIFYGEAFLPAVDVFYALIPTIIFWPLNQFLSEHISGFGKPEKIFMVRVVALPVYVIACFFIIPRYGAVGAASILSAVYLLLALLCLRVYIDLTKATFSDVMLLSREDFVYYRKVTAEMLKRIGLF